MCRTKEDNPDIMIITEIYPKNSTYQNFESLLQLPGYDLWSTDSGRGIAIYTAVHLLATQIDIDHNFKEHIWCNIQISHGHNIIIGGIYRSPNSESTNNEELIPLISKAMSIKHDHIIIAGDFNLKKINWSDFTVSATPNSFSQKIFDGINDLFLQECIKQPTRFRNTNTPSTLDWILTENQELIDNLCIEPPIGSSDHSLVSIEYTCNIERDIEHNIFNRSYYKGNYDNIREDLIEIDWDKELKNKSTQESWDFIHKRYNGLIERHIPLKKFTTSNKNPWYNRSLASLNKLKKKAWKTYQHDPSQEKWLQYTAARNSYNHAIDKSKENYENKIASEVKENPKQFWKYVNKKTKTKGKITELLNPAGNAITDDKGKAEILNDHFASVFTKEKMDDIPQLDLEKDDINIIDSVTVSTEKLIKLLNKLNISKSAGPDGINSRILKETSSQIAPGLKILFDKSISEGKIPSQWKEANVTALFKKGSKNLLITIDQLA